MPQLSSGLHVGLFLELYGAGMLLLACWLGWNMHRKLDRYDWHYYRSDIWINFWLHLIFWPILIIFAPSSLCRPTFSFGRSWGDLAERERQQVTFMESPPLCGVTVSYSPDNADGTHSKAEFLFSAADVEKAAEKIALESPHLVGMKGAMRWTSQRNASIAGPTPVPEILPNFDYIAEALIEAGTGEVKCPQCCKTYSVSELERKTSSTQLVTSGWIFANFLCSAGHSLLLREVAHLLLRRNDA
jgi:hypothetical protein